MNNSDKLEGNRTWLLELSASLLAGGTQSKSPPNVNRILSVGYGIIMDKKIDVGSNYGLTILEQLQKKNNVMVPK